MKKFGGQGKKKQKCIQRVCIANVAIKAGKTYQGERAGNTQGGERAGNTQGGEPTGNTQGGLCMLVVYLILVGRCTRKEIS